MSINSGVPNQSGLSTPYIFTAVAPGGTPPPASEPGSALKVFVPGQASTGQQGSAATETLGAAGITVPVEQIVGEVQKSGFQANGSLSTAVPVATVSAGAPQAGSPPPDPAPTVKEATGAASTGNQPSGNTPFSSNQWENVASV
jgi:hypothetical protein